MKALAFREAITVVDMLENQGFGTSALDFVAEFGLISVATADFPDNPHVQQAAQIYGGKHYGLEYGIGSGREVGDGTGRGREYCNAASGRGSADDEGSNTYDYDYGRSFQNGYCNRKGDGVGFGIGRGYGSGYHYGDGSGGGNCYGHLYGEDYISPWAAPLEWDQDEGAVSASDAPTAVLRSEPEVLEALAARLLDAARVPASHRASFSRTLRFGTAVDPKLILWLSAPSGARRWRDLVATFDSSNEGAPSAAIRARGQALLLRAETTQTWPRQAITVLRRQRTESGTCDSSSFPQLPEKLQPWRDALHAVALETRALLYDAFARPADISWSGKVCFIVVLGCLRARFDFEARDIHIDELDASGWSHVPGAFASLLHPLPTDVWCRDFALRLREPVRAALGKSWGKSKIRHACFIWLTDVVQQLAADSKLIEHARDLIRKAYPCSEQIVRDALMCRMDPERHEYFTTLEYVAAWRDSEVLRTRVAEAPGLAPVWGMAREADYLKVTDDYDALRSLVRRWGVTPAGWKLLTRYGRELYLPLIDIPRSAKNMLQTLVGYVRILQRVQCVEPMPIPLVKALYGQHWFSNNLDLDKLPLGLIRGAIERYESATSPRAQSFFVEHEFVQILGWIARAKPTFDKNQQRASWDWFFARYQLWSETERRKRIGRCWETGIDGLRWRDYHVTPIRDSVTLWREGEQMRMCLSQFEKDCVKGRYIVYAVRATDRARPIAHIGLELNSNGRFELDQVQGFANFDVESALKAYAKKLPAFHSNQNGVMDTMGTEEKDQ